MRWRRIVSAILAPGPMQARVWVTPDTRNHETQFHPGWWPFYEDMCIFGLATDLAEQFSPGPSGEVLAVHCADWGRVWWIGPDSGARDPHNVGPKLVELWGRLAAIWRDLARFRACLGPDWNPPHVRILPPNRPHPCTTQILRHSELIYEI